MNFPGSGEVLAPCEAGTFSCGAAAYAWLGGGSYGDAGWDKLPNQPENGEVSEQVTVDGTFERDDAFYSLCSWIFVAFRFTAFFL